MDLKNQLMNFLFLVCTAFFTFTLAHLTRIDFPGVLSLLGYLLITGPPLAGLLYIGEKVRSDYLIYFQISTIAIITWLHVLVFKL
ncbi:hypothetical protein AKJ39_01645 [candidate division MSBL1 archaeon SCGC-AAA259J03]|uniref:Uncharacterized protein n=1 Tax=candidate division MSBL1 archaeon SCGC-AAA259J03 TaxID=1698269 RepID=A0A656YWN4_9EURY|nr:hypothetical protein AKJ39_01645 [candidate division MSBL1 archaeon SCGC-AAA259J03]